jgi:acyl-CoA synthetase (AMP-forming)/AMP-acid ligase II
VLGRLGDALKLRGRLLLAEDLEAALARDGVPAAGLAVLMGSRGVEPTAVAVLERADPDLLATAAVVLRRNADGVRVVVVDADRGTIARTSSGKPRRRVMWQRFLAGTLADRHDGGT